MRKPQRRDVRNMVRAVQKRGAQVRATKHGYLVRDRQGNFVTVIPGSPGDHRSLRNTEAELRRHNLM